jgi:nucleotide-binding universal stress UspA family protein
MKTHKPKIVCATNFSSHANSAALAAAWMSARLDAPLRLVHVIDPTRYRGVPTDFMDYLRKQRQKKLDPLIDCAGHRGATVEGSIIEGSPVASITGLASESDVRLLVLAATGQISATQWLTGSVTDGVAQRASAPTLVLRHAKRIEAWLKGERSLRVVVGYDFSPTADAALAWSDSLREFGPIELTVLYVASPANERLRLQIAPPLSPFYYPSGLKRFLESELKQATDARLGEDAAAICVKADWGRVDAQIIESAMEIRADLIVTGTSGRRGFARLASVSRSVLHYAPANVACVPACGAENVARADMRQFHRATIPLKFPEAPEQAVA